MARGCRLLRMVQHASRPLAQNSSSTNDARALVGNGTRASLTDLGPGEINAIDAGVQIGLTGSQFASAERAALWTGTEASRIRLHPVSYSTSLAEGGDPHTQTGAARTMTVSRRRESNHRRRDRQMVDAGPATR